VQLAGDELAVGVRQLKPQRSGSVEAACRGEGGDAAGEADLFGYAAPNRIRMHISGDLLRHLRLSKPNRLCSLQRRGDGPQPLQPGNPINPSRIPSGADIGDGSSQLSEHLIETHHQRVPGRWFDLER
jgi:hypothetical protein